MTFVPSNLPVSGKQETPLAAPATNEQQKVLPSDFDVPFIPLIDLNLAEIPSKGLPYPKGAAISYRPYLYGEVKQISQSKIQIRGMIDHILNGIECSFPKYDITLADLLYIGLLRKISTIGDTELMLPYVCPNCFAKNTPKVDTSVLDFDYIGVPALPIRAVMSKGTLVFKPLTVGKFIELINDGKQEDEIAYLVYQCDGIKINNSVMPVNRESLHRYFSMANTVDGAVLTQVDKRLYHGVKPVSVVCSNKSCNFETSIALDGGEAYLIPFHSSDDERKKSIESKLSFGE